MDISSPPVASDSGSRLKQSPIIKWAFVMGIMIVANLFLTYLVDVLYDAPAFTDFCQDRQVNQVIDSEAACLEVGGQWNENMDRQKPVPQSILESVPAGYCDVHYTCGKQYAEAMSVYHRNVFVVFIIAGIVLLIGSVYLGRSEAVSLGAAFGGVLAFVIGATRYWSDMDDILRVMILGAALIGLVFVAWKKFKV